MTDFGVLVELWQQSKITEDEAVTMILDRKNRELLRLYDQAKTQVVALQDALDRATEKLGVVAAEKDLLRRYRCAHISMALVAQEAGAAEKYRLITEEVDAWLLKD